MDTSTPDGKKIAEALSDRSAQGIAGYTWQQKQSFGMANNAVNQVSGINSGMGIMGVAMMANAFGGGGGGGMGSAMMQTPNPNQYAMGNTGGAASMNKRAEVFCSNCAKKYPSTSKFCPFCGDAYNPCPACGADNSSSAKRCVSCGTQLQAETQQAGGNACSKCGTSVQPGIRFCPTCGNKLM